MTPEERAILVMRYGHDLEIADVARLLGQQLGTTKSKLYRSLRKVWVKPKLNSGTLFGRLPLKVRQATWSNGRL